MALKTRPTVKATVFRDMFGDPVSGSTAIVAAYRAAAEDGNADATKHLTDDKVLQIVLDIPGDGDDADTARVQALLDAEGDVADEATVHGTGDVPATDTPLKSASGNSAMDRAAPFAVYMANDKELDAFLGRLEGAKETVNEAPLAILMRWRKDFGATEAEARKRICEMPIPGTDRKNSNNPDKDSFSYINADGESRTQQTSFYAELYLATTRGQALTAKLEVMKQEKRDGTISDVRRWKQEFDNLNQRKNLAAQNFRKAAKVEMQMAAIAELLPNLDVRIARVLDKDGKPTAALLPTPKPIVLADKNAPETAEVFSITQFLSYKPRLAKGGTKAHLKETAKRAPRDGEKNTLDISQLPSMAVAEGYAAHMSAAFENKEWAGKMQKQLLSEESDSLVLSMFNLSTELEYLFIAGSPLRLKADKLRDAAAETKRQEMAAKKAA